MSDDKPFEITWFRCDGGQEAGVGEPGKRRWFFEDRDGGWALHERHGEITEILGIWASDGDASFDRAGALAEANKIVNARAGW